METETLMALGKYLNETIHRETCDNTLSRSETWLRSKEYPDVDADLDWLQSHGANCDCQVVLKIYLPAVQKSLDNTIAVAGTDTLF